MHQEKAWVEELEFLPVAAEVVEELISLSSGLMAKALQRDMSHLPYLHHRKVEEDRHLHRQMAVADLRHHILVKALSVAEVEEFLEVSAVSQAGRLYSLEKVDLAPGRW
jgi:hypothetical protein